MINFKNQRLMKYGANNTRRLFSIFYPKSTRDASRFVIDGKGRKVGMCLLIYAGCLFTSLTLHGYTKNMRYGMNKIEWRMSGKFPKTDDDWNQKYEEFKKWKEYTIRGYEVNLDTFKQIYWISTLSIIGPLSSLFIGTSMTYFWRRGYFKIPMKRFLKIYALLYFTIALQGYYQDNYRPSQVEGLPVPPKDPYQKTLHSGLFYVYAGLGLWQSMNLLRKSPDLVPSFERFIGNWILRRHLMITSHSLFFIVLASGLLMSGTGAGRSITTFPKVNDKWVITKDDFDSDSSTLQNLYENRKVIHFTHRTLGMSLFGLLSIQFLILLRSPISLSSKALFSLLTALTYAQIYIGAHQITHNMPWEITMLHNGNGALVLALFLLLMHIARRPSPEVAKSLANNLKLTNSEKYDAFAKSYSKYFTKYLNEANKKV